MKYIKQLKYASWFGNIYFAALRKGVENKSISGIIHQFSCNKAIMIGAIIKKC